MSFDTNGIGLFSTHLVRIKYIRAFVVEQRWLNKNMVDKLMVNWSIVDIWISGKNQHATTDTNKNLISPKLNVVAFFYDEGATPLKTDILAVLFRFG